MLNTVTVKPLFLPCAIQYHEISGRIRELMGCNVHSNIIHRITILFNIYLLQIVGLMSALFVELEGSTWLIQMPAIVHNLASFIPFTSSQHTV
jgi:hypothetical protein